jgi:dienelactone hydrolase
VERFNIDRKRIYMTGTSMGGGGTAEWVWALPETAAAYCPRAGYYWRNPPVGPRCIALGKPVMVIHGEKDEPKRNVGRDYYLKETESRGAVMSHISYPDRDHFLTPEEVFPHMIPFFRKHTNPVEPDLRLLRAAALRRLQGQRPSAGAIDDSAKADAPPPEPVIPPAK